MTAGRGGATETHGEVFFIVTSFISSTKNTFRAKNVTNSDSAVGNVVQRV